MDAKAPPRRLLAADEPAPVTVERPDAPSVFLLACDHAGKRIPRALGDLGLSAEDRERHIAWDIGALAVARDLSARLDATLISQTYSRLVIDCNRDPSAADSIATVSETTPIPGNENLAPEDAEARVREILRPYQDAIGAALDARDRAGRRSVLVAVHSFTPVYKGVARPWHIGILYNRDPRLPHAVLARARAAGDLCVGDNEPYRVSDATDYTIPVHGEKRGIAHVEIEIRQDLVADKRGQGEWAARLEDYLTGALADIEAAGVWP